MATKTLVFEAPEAQTLMMEAQAARNTADLLVILDDQGLEIAKNEMNAMTKQIKLLESKRKELTGPLDQAKKGIMDLFREPVESYKESVKIIKAGIAEYLRQKERKAAEERAKAEAVAAAERKALEEKVKAAECAEQAEAYQKAASLVVAGPTKTQVKKVQGMSTQKRWRARVYNLSAFLAHAATHPELIDCVEIKQGSLERFISATGGTIAIPGVEAYQQTIVTSRGG